MDNFDGLYFIKNATEKLRLVRNILIANYMFLKIIHDILPDGIPLVHSQIKDTTELKEKIKANLISQSACFKDTDVIQRVAKELKDEREL